MRVYERYRTALSSRGESRKRYRRNHEHVQSARAEAPECKRCSAMQRRRQRAARRRQTRSAASTEARRTLRPPLLPRYFRVRFFC